MALFLDSERVAPTGNVTSKGIINQLGRPGLDLLAVLVREAVQNSWDARSTQSGQIQFGMRGWTLSDAQYHILRETVFESTPPGGSLDLNNILKTKSCISVLAVSDRGTTGLGGPTRADVITQSDEPRDFVDFLRNVGQPPDKLLSGGTYGYGKAALYRASHAKTICVYTRCQVDGKLESRFIASALGDPYNTSDHRFTGRHWWGRQAGNIAEPVLNTDADALARDLGLTVYNGDESGTTILIVDPILSDKESAQKTPLQSFKLMAEYILLYFWPKMLSCNNQEPAIKFELSWQGELIDIPSPHEFPPLQGYVEAMMLLKGHLQDHEALLQSRLVNVESKRPKKHLGQLAIQQYLTSNNHYFDTGNSESAFSPLTHHTALMRQPELVVKYLPGPPTINEKFGYAGVFITDEKVDAIFAESEPPTHDDWVSKSLGISSHKTFVNVALREIENAMALFAKPPAAHNEESKLIPTGAFANILGSSLIPVEQGPAAIAKPFSISHLGSSQRKLPTAVLKRLPTDLTKDFPELDNLHQNRDTISGGVIVGVAPEIRSLLLVSSESFSDKCLDKSLDSNGEEDRIRQTHVYEAPKYEKPSLKSTQTLGKSRVIHVDDTYVSVDKAPAVQFEFDVLHGKNSSGTNVRLKVNVVLDGNKLEDEPPLGSTRPRLLYWIDPNGVIYAGSSEQIFVDAKMPGNWYVIVSLPDDTMISVEFAAEARA